MPLLCEASPPYGDTRPKTQHHLWSHGRHLDLGTPDLIGVIKQFNLKFIYVIETRKRGVTEEEERLVTAVKRKKTKERVAMKEEVEETPFLLFAVTAKEEAHC